MTTPDVNTASRNDDVTTCGQCGTAFTPIGRQAWCSPACRVAAWRRRHNIAVLPRPPLPPKGQRRAATVYACPNCDARALGEQYCNDCATFMHKIGIGGTCPACSEAISFDELEAEA